MFEILRQNRETTVLQCQMDINQISGLDIK